MNTLQLVALAIYAVGFAGFTFTVGHALRSRGRIFLNHTFERQPAVAESVHFLLSLGFYLMCLSLLLWNLGIEPSRSFKDGIPVFTTTHLVQTVAERLGISIFVVAAFHTLNILILSILNRNNLVR